MATGAGLGSHAGHAASGCVIQLTPAWSPDGKRVAFTSWHDVDQGHVWTVSPDGKRPTRLTDEPGMYAYPAWSPDSKHLVVAKGPGPNAPDAWSGWDVEGQWTIVEVAGGKTPSCSSRS